MSASSEEILANFDTVSKAAKKYGYELNLTGTRKDLAKSITPFLKLAGRDESLPVSERSSCSSSIARAKHLLTRSENFETLKKLLADNGMYLAQTDNNRDSKTTNNSKTNDSNNNDMLTGYNASKTSSPNKTAAASVDENQEQKSAPQQRSKKSGYCAIL